jgi:hypothetical protein
MITRERAEEIKQKAIDMDRYGPWSDRLEKAMTSEEHQQVMQYWATLPGSASYFDAFLDFLQGTTHELG